MYSPFLSLAFIVASVSYLGCDPHFHPSLCLWDSPGLVRVLCPCFFHLTFTLHPGLLCIYLTSLIYCINYCGCWQNHVILYLSAQLCPRTSITWKFLYAIFYRKSQSPICISAYSSAFSGMLQKREKNTYIYTHTHIYMYTHTYTHLCSLISFIYENMWRFIHIVMNQEFIPFHYWVVFHCIYFIACYSLISWKIPEFISVGGSNEQNSLLLIFYYNVTQIYINKEHIKNF